MKKYEKCAYSNGKQNQKKIRNFIYKYYTRKKYKDKFNTIA